MKQYLDMLQDVLDNGVGREDRTGTGTIGVFGRQVKFDLREGFPVLTTKKLHLKSIIHELLWFLKGETNIKYLKENGVTIWDEWRKPFTLNRELKNVEIKFRDVVFCKNTEFAQQSFAGFSEIDYKLCCIWRNMMARCYAPDNHNYKFYGEIGASVSEDWQNLETFIKEVKEIPHWYYKEKDWNNFELDKDYFSSNLYSKDTCVWLHSSENACYTKSVKPVRVYFPDGKSKVFLSIGRASDALGIPTTTLHRFILAGSKTSTLKGNNKKFKNYHFQFEPCPEGYVKRLAIIPDGELGPVYGAQWRAWPGLDGQPIDQIANLIEELKNNPWSRRHMVSAWNVAFVEDMALPPCHLLFQFCVVPSQKEGESHGLSLHMYQRSADLFLGVPFNITSYALLLQMVAQVCGYEARELTMSFGDLHLYNNHLDQAREQLTREPRKLPVMEINPDVDNIDGFKYEDFTLTGYDPHPTIKAAISV